MRDEILAGEDAAWLHMESPTNPMVVNALVELTQRIDFDAVEHLAERIAALPRFSSRIVTTRRSVGTSAWEAVEGFRARDQVSRIELDSTSDAALRDEIGMLVSRALDMNRPPWRVHVMDRPNRGTTILFRVHHALADGFALLGVLASLSDEGTEAVDVAPHHARGLRAGELRGSVRALHHLMTSPVDPPVLKRALSLDKRVAWTTPIALDEVKSIARATSSTVNDVLVATVTGALARLLARRGAATCSKEIHALVPVNLREGARPGAVGNEFGVVFLGLPIGISDPLARIHAVKTRMEAIKGTPEAGVAHDLLRLVGWAPPRIESAAVAFFGRKASLVLTNVPGPRRLVSLEGVQVARIMFWVPQASRMGLGISIFSYAREITIGVFSDAAIIRRPEELVADLQAELVSLAACLHAAQ